MNINANGSNLTLAISMSAVDSSNAAHGVNGLKWSCDASQRAAMVYSALFCRTTAKDDESLQSETVKMLENGEWKDNFKFLGIPVKVDRSVPIGTVLLMDGDSVLAEINNLTVPQFYHGY